MTPNNYIPVSSPKHLIDASVMECYFREHLAERNLLFHKTLAAQLNDYNPGADDATQTQYLAGLQNRLQASDLPEKLRLIPEKSPELLGVILKEVDGLSFHNFLIFVMLTP